MVYVLIVIVFGGGSAVSSVEFNSKTACFDAMTAVTQTSDLQRAQGWVMQPPPQLTCAPKGVLTP